MVSSKTVVILALSRYIIRNYSEATQNRTEASTLLPWQTNITFIILTNVLKCSQIFVNPFFLALFQVADNRVVLSFLLFFLRFS